MDQVTERVLGRMMTADSLRAQIAETWSEADRDVASHEGDRLLAIAPGEEILNVIFERFAGRAFDKRRDGPAIAKAVAPPAEIREILDKFMAD